MSDDQHHLEAGTSACKKQLLELKASTSNHIAADKSSLNLFKEDDYSRRRKSEIEQLEGRLRVLEEEAEMLKGALCESIEERTKLMIAINEHFDTFLLQRDSDRRELYGHEFRMISILKDRRAGLLQILSQESNPFIVYKGLRAKPLASDSTNLHTELKMAV